jgi:hypothetical protein
VRLKANPTSLMKPVLVSCEISVGDGVLQVVMP